MEGNRDQGGWARLSRRKLGGKELRSDGGRTGAEGGVPEMLQGRNLWDLESDQT